MVKDVCGIYQIKNKINGKVYIGSSKHIYQRWKEHISQLDSGKHGNAYLQNAWNKYGKDNFSFEILNICDEQERYTIEEQYINNNCATNRLYGYNIKSTTIPSDVDVAEYESRQANSLRNSHKVGKDWWSTKYSEEQAKMVIEMLQDENIMYDEIEQTANVSRSFILNIRDHNAWNHLCNNIVFPNRKNYCRNGKVSKLSTEDVLDIINRLLQSDHFSDIANDYNVRNTTIIRIYSHKIWKDLTDGIVFPEINNKGEQAGMAKLSENQAIEIYNLRKNGGNPSDIANKYHISIATVYDIYSGRSWKNIKRE